jgi:hypothetical protein
MTPREQLHLAGEFWERVGFDLPFPRDLERVIPLAVPAWVVRLDGLRPLTARRWLLRRGLRLPLTTQDRPLDGCVLAYRGRAAIFLEAGLDADLGRVVLAHELGHLLADYERPRRRALGRLGVSVLPVLDGERAPAPEEEWAGLLAGVPLGPHVHLMERAFAPDLGGVSRAEREASELACELLAPESAVLTEGRDLPDAPLPWQEFLQQRFGIPPRWGAGYAARLLRRRRRQRSFSDFLGL